MPLSMRRSGDFIYVKNLLLKTVSGRDGWNRSIAQPHKLSIGINVGQRLRRLALSDDIRRTLNYDSLSSKIILETEKNESLSVEATALATVDAIKPYLHPGEWAVVSLSRPKAHLLAQAHEIELRTDRPEQITECLRNLNVPIIIGINALERINKQEIQLNVEVKRPPNLEFFSRDMVSRIAQFAQSSSFLTIESFVNSLAEFICRQNGQMVEIKVSAAKPSALNMADCAGVQVTRKPADFSQHDAKESGNLVYIAFGTNQGDRLRNVSRAVEELRRRRIFVERSSLIYESEPMYFAEQPRFLNGVFRCRTALDPPSLLKSLKDVEYNAFKRVKQFDNGPRTLDLDILLFNSDYIETESLTVPHKDMLNRSFVLRPLNDLLSNKPSSRYELPQETSETVVVPLYNKSAADVPVSLEFNPSGPGKMLPTKIMSILNATPDSFSDGGELSNNVTERASEALQSGATILDVGGYSTRPGAAEVSVEEESRRVCETIKQIRVLSPEVIISVDTFRGSVAKDALEQGANLINDVFAGTLDPSILDVAAQTGAPIVLSHSRGSPQTMREHAGYPTGVLNEVATELRARVEAALAAGCQTWQIILDPGLGFAKSAEHDLELVKNFRQLKAHPILTDGLPVFPWLVGPSRKSFIGYAVGAPEPKNRIAGTLAVVTALRQQGADIVRVHDTQLAGQALKIADLIYDKI